MWTKVNEIIDSHRKFLLTTHISPDGDGIGSEVALAAHLRSLGKDASIINSHPIPSRYSFLDAEGEIKVYRPEVDLKTIHDRDVIFILDNSVMERLGTMSEDIKRSLAVKVCIDHHVGSAHNNSFDVTVSDENASAVGEMVYSLIKSRTDRLSLKIAESLYVSIMTDTGSFRFSNTNPGAHVVAADLIASGVRPQEIYRKVYECSSEGWIKLLGRLLAGMAFECGGQMAWFKVTDEMLKAYRVSLEEAKEFIDFPRLVDGVEVIILFIEAEDGKVKVSVRSKGRLPINSLAARFGGGGHIYAAGMIVEGEMEGVTREVVEEAKKLFG
jgi:phosphoesterase RecJ-like protein